MKMKLLINGFSANMIAPRLYVHMDWIPMSLAAAKRLMAGGEYRSVVGHTDTAAIFSDLLDMPVPCNRETVLIEGHAKFILGSYRGPRLEEGAHKLPDGASIEWYHVIVVPD
jgi:hypothetical protein